MRWLAVLLVAANLAVGAYLVFIAPGASTTADLSALEHNANQVRVLRSGAAPIAMPRSAKDGPRACLEWGRFSAPELARAREQLQKLNIRKFSVRELESPQAWWVHVAALKSREDAERVAKELRELGIKDARVVTSGRWDNAISLGIFKAEAAALAYQQRMLATKVQNVAVAQRDDLLRLSVIVIEDPSPAVAARLVEFSAAIAGTELKAVACAAGG
jgi:hypothetical protein